MEVSLVDVLLHGLLEPQKGVILKVWNYSHVGTVKGDNGSMTLQKPLWLFSSLAFEVLHIDHIRKYSHKYHKLF
jgi:hypothetical protein